MIQSRTFNTVPGSFFLLHPSLANSQILGVEREGLGYTKVASTPGNREFKYSSIGSITFNTAFLEGPFATDLEGEKVWVLWQ